MPPHRTVGHRRASVCLGLALLIGSAGGCGRDALPELCPNVAEGELVISELRGAQAGQDSFGDYIEVYNGSGHSVDLEGMKLSLRSSGGEVLELFVRDSIELAAGEYAVIGPGLEEDVPTWIDYGVAWDISGGTPESDAYPRDFMRYRSAFVEIEACGSLIDRVFFETDALTDTGTMACGNAQNPPVASDNDNVNAGCWCVDDLGAEGQPLFGVGLPGSPGEVNRCP
ncbi:hypothetical protein DB30_02117 [Enhygromyxa salina]|uniref:LTD domain-containing protein n=1 Tax=Enhygromyxa salina TaxID=215803 RepID=A0A0C2CVX7_9BACT|nr:lamin tail domain-containing protein [Enhygromyxa salina]KIG12032.1 hypothetical protein DB30_02117 [Enhygromyxa salina]